MEGQLPTILYGGTCDFGPGVSTMGFTAPLFFDAYNPKASAPFNLSRAYAFVLWEGLRDLWWGVHILWRSWVRGLAVVLVKTKKATRLEFGRKGGSGF
jgi:hypothetical protein